MARTGRIENKVLLQAGLELMQKNGKRLSKMPSKGRSMLYKMPNSETVRVRTCNDHILIAVAESPAKDAQLNIEGTDWLLIVMPEVERTKGNIIGYLVPTVAAVKAVRQEHAAWLATNPNTKGRNTTWNLWFGHDGAGKANNYAVKWAKYRLDGAVYTRDLEDEEITPSSDAGNIRAEVEAARQRIANAAGIPLHAVKISIDFAA